MGAMTVGLVLPAPPRLASLVTLLKICSVVVRWSPASMPAFIYCLASCHTMLAYNLASTSWRSAGARKFGGVTSSSHLG
jgi:hypothetical protein